MGLAALSGRILVVNSGSSSLKVRVIGADDAVVSSADLPSMMDGAREGLELFVRGERDVDAVGHRVVHGGPDLREPVVITDAVLARLRALVELAPLHQPAGIAAIEAASVALPGVPQIACFDTAFHATIPDGAAIYAIPREWTLRFGIRRYGFHGLSHAYAARRSAELIGRPLAEIRVVTCHLGAGASLAAVDGGRSVDTTMGFTPLEGLVMATRAGTVDPGLLLWLQRRGLAAEEIEDALERRSGLLGVSGLSGDMREVLAATERGDERAVLALAIYLHRLRAGIAQMVAAMGGVDAIAFTGGVGEGSARIRQEACDGLAFLGVALDAAINERSNERSSERSTEDADLSLPSASTRVLLVRAREDLEVARATRRILTHAS